MIEIVLFSLIFLNILSAEIISDYYLIEIKGVIPKHGWSWLVRGLCMVLNSLWFCWWYFELSFTRMLVENTLFSLLQFAVFWLLFDLILNRLRKKPTLYFFGNQSVSKIDKWFVTVFKGDSIYIKFITKILFLLTVVALLIIT